jgi:hypothetical protein
MEFLRLLHSQAFAAHDDFVGQAILPAAAFQAALWLRFCCSVGQLCKLTVFASLKLSRRAMKQSLAIQK